MEIKTNVSGSHNSIHFNFADGVLWVHGKAYDKRLIRAIVQLANLLEVHGYTVAEEMQFDPLEAFKGLPGIADDEYDACQHYDEED